MDLIFDLVDLPVLTQAAREIDPPALYGVVDALLPARTIDDVEYKIRRGTITRGVAMYRSFDTPTPMGKRTGTSKDTTQKLPPLGLMQMVGEYESIMLARMNGQANGALARQIYDDTASNTEAIHKRNHRAVGEVVSTGQQVINENGFIDTVVFDVPSGNLGQVPDTLFSDDSADILQFFEDLSALYETNSDDGQRPGRFTTSRRVANAIRRNVQMTRLTKGALNSDSLPLTLAQVNANLDEFGFPPIVIDESKVDGQRVFPDDTIIATPANPADLGRTVFGITAQAIQLVNSNAVDFLQEEAPGIVVTTWHQQNPPAVFSSADAVALPVLERPDLLATAVVL